MVSSSNHIATRFEHLKDGSIWVVSNIYAPNNKVARWNLWVCLCNFRSSIGPLKWLVMGDYNTHIHYSDKKGGAPIVEDSSQDILSLINSQGL